MPSFQVTLPVWSTMQLKALHIYFSPFEVLILCVSWLDFQPSGV
jgi:hypothetical protein